MILYLHKTNNDLKANMNVHAHAVNRKMFQGITVSYFWRRIMILQRNISVTSYQIDRDKKIIRNIYAKNAIII